MALNPSNYPPVPVSMFAHVTDWKLHDGAGQPVADEQYVKVMYSNGAVASMVRPAFAWTNWTGGRNWWKTPEPADRLYIAMYCVV